MKTYKKISFIVLFFLVLTATESCKNGNEVAIVARNFSEEIQLTQNLIFTFNENLRAAGSASEDDWEYTNYVNIEPKVNGAFRWNSPSELVFSPAEGFQPSTEYKLTISKEILKGSNEKVSKKNVSKEVISFHTPYLQPMDVQTYWDIDKTGQAVVKAKTNFNYPVDNESLNKNISIDASGVTQNFIVENTATTSSPNVVLTNFGTKKEASVVKINLEKGIMMAGGGHSTKQKFNLENVIPSALELAIVNIEPAFENDKGYIKIKTSQRLDGRSLGKGYTISPAVETTAEATENELLIRGDFSPDESYTITLNENLRGVLGGKLSENYTDDVFFGELPQNIVFASTKGFYLSSKGEKNVGLRISNVDEVQVKVAKIYENNILGYTQNNRYENYAEEGTSTTFEYSEDYNGTYGDEILSRNIRTNDLPKARGVSLLNLSLPINNKLKGVFLVSVNAKDSYYLSARKLVAISDIGLIAKQSADGNETIVFVNSLIDAEPMSGVEIGLVSSNNQEMTTEKTDSKGIAIFKNLKDKAPNFKAAMITARTAEDFNFLLLNDTQVETSRYEVDGQRSNPSGMDAFLYGDRDIYRPGETMHLNTILRDNKRKTTANYPVKISVLQPNGRELVSHLVQTNAFGAVALDVPLDRAAVTGTYQVVLSGADGNIFSSKYISVEEFMPDRINVKLAAKDRYQKGEAIQLAATATNLYGPPAIGRAYEMDMSLKRKEFLPKNYPTYRFDIPNESSFNNVVRQGKTDEKGLAKETFSMDDSYNEMGVLEGKIFVTVTDEMGRPVNRVKRFDVFTQTTFFGIGIADYYVGTHVPMAIDVVALNQDEKLVKSTANIEVFRIEYQTVIEKNDEGTHYKSRKKEILVQSKPLDFPSGKAKTTFIPQVSGEYEIRVARPNGKGYATRQFYAYGYGATSSSSFEVSNEGQVSVTFDKEKYEVGDNAKVLLNAPFAGKMLVTVEKQNVLEHFYIETDKKSVEVDFKITAEMLPNAYVTATLIRPMKNSDMPLTVAHGFAPMYVEKSSNKLPVEINVAAESRSKRKQKVSIKTKPNTQLTIAVVDEGILQLKNFKTPDIYNHFYRKQALEVTSHDLYALLFPELSISSLSSVGGDGYDLEKRVNPLSNGRNKLVAIWSGQRTSNGSGMVDFEIDIPQFSGDLRVMAVAYNGEAFGSTSKNMKVKDPIVISAGVPRFLSPNDELMLPISITNTTKQATAVKTVVTTEGGLVVQEGQNQQLSIAADKEQQAMVTIKAPATLGTSKIKIAVKAFNETFIEEIEVTVRPSTSLLKTSLSGTVLAGQTKTIDLTNDYMAGTASANLLVSKSPMVQFGKQLDYLLGYPHGCIEQTVSKAFPQLYFSEFVQSFSYKKYRSAGVTDWNPRYNVQAAISRIEAMQLFNGAVPYWQGDSEENWWGTAYAAHFLIEARKAGYEVNESSLNRITDYLNGSIANKEKTATQRFYLENGNVTTETIAKREVIYSLYVLALNGSANQSGMNYFRENAKLLTTDERYLLAAAFKEIGNENAYKALLPKAFGVDKSMRELDGSFASPVRNLAISLNGLLASDPDNLQIPAMARQLSQAVQNASYLNTQESSFAFLALGKIAQKANRSDITASIFVANKLLQSLKNEDITIEKGIAGKKITISAKGKGTLYYFAQQEGLSATGNYIEEDQQIKVRRQFFSRTGQAITDNNFKANQLVVVKITASSLAGTNVPNVVITDMLPAAFEIENPRLNDARDMPWIKNAATPKHFDIRDDRINYFTDLGSEEKAFYYLVRVVAKGKFTLGTVSADAMYDAAYHSYHGGGTVRSN